ncbi:hypothetical protein MAR621_03057 [Maribacter dokdonensis]|uniref:hypothetical protein n=1 Tax=Maribacter dokdonensis TaxID=320912 RepID=UPI001B17ACD2|nr:hypothetical protein [Maribacter dokdonensis]CAG2532863.1 hypothetical protein MAR621_03057 [Maribacter dokdonensis]
MNTYKNFLAALVIVLFYQLIGAQTNLIDSSTWSIGIGSTVGFAAYGPDAESERILDTTPLGQPGVLWMSVPDGSTSNTPDGGYYSDFVDIDPTKTYRFSVWMKKTGDDIGNSYLGLYIQNSSGGHTTFRLDGTLNTNPYFWSGDLPILNKWFLIVAYVHPGIYGGADQGGIYDPVTGTKVNSHAVVDFKFGPGSIRLMNRGILYGNRNNSTNRQFYWNPTIYEVNGQEPAISEMLNLSGAGGGSGSQLWTQSGNDIYFDTGNVGIGTSDPDTFKLAVNGNVRTQEIRVETANWPDYVFRNDYQLPSLNTVKNFIEKRGHLPSIPPASELTREGLELGEMNKLLLQKIEELTLYILERENRIQLLEENSENKKTK